MKILVVGGAGYVGSILCPTLTQHHDLYCYDRAAIPELGDRSLVGDVNDSETFSRAVAGMEGVVYLAMGVRIVNGVKTVGDVDTAFDVNVRGLYRVLVASLAAGVRHFVFASTLSVYTSARRHPRVDEMMPPDAWEPYGVSKHLGEELCLVASRQYPDATIIALRLMLPRSDANARGHEYRHGSRNSYALMPNDTRRLFLAALECNRPGAHIVQTTGDLDAEQFPNDRATALLGWKPIGD